LFGGNEEDDEILQFKFLVTETEFEPGNFRIRARLADLFTARYVDSRNFIGIFLIKLTGNEAFGRFRT
jgi:hypothetical protein